MRWCQHLTDFMTKGMSILSPCGELCHGILACLGPEQVVVALAVQVIVAAMHWEVDEKEGPCPSPPQYTQICKPWTAMIFLMSSICTISEKQLWRTVLEGFTASCPWWALPPPHWLAAYQALKFERLHRATVVILNTDTSLQNFMSG